MNRNIVLKAVCGGCILALLSGCGTKASQPPAVVEKPDSVETAVENERQGYITVEEAKAAALENVGLLEENVRFVRINLDAGSGAARYDLEFISEDAEYDYAVDAVTGEIISMLCENGAYDIEELPLEAGQSGQTEPAAGESAKEQEQPETEQPAQEPAAGQSAQDGAGQKAQGQSGGEQSTQSQPQSGQSAQAQSQSGQSAQSQPAAQPAQSQSDAGQQFIGVEAAKKKALEHSGLSAEEVRFVHAHLELDDGRWQYDVEFHKDGTEYDYDIDAKSGEIISFDHDAEYYQHGADSSSGSEQITGDRAKKIALEYAGISEAETRNLTVEFDYDDGRAEYQVEWDVGRMEYSCDVDAITGAILSFEKEYD